RPLPACGAPNPVRSAHLDTALARRPEIEVPLQRPTLDLAPVLHDVRFKLRMVVGERRTRAEVLFHVVQMLVGAEENVRGCYLAASCGHGEALLCSGSTTYSPQRPPASSTCAPRPPHPVLRAVGRPAAGPPAGAARRGVRVVLFGFPRRRGLAKTSGICAEYGSRTQNIKAAESCGVLSRAEAAVADRLRK